MSVPGMETCASCGTQFRTREAIENFGRSRSHVNWPAIPPWVECPKCSSSFRSRGIRYFGFIPATHFRIGIFIFAFSLLAISIYTRMKH